MTRSVARSYCDSWASCNNLLMQTEIICPQTHNWISHFTYSLLLHYLEKCNRIHFSQKLLNKSAMHAVISLWLQSRKFWWNLLLTSSTLLYDVIMTSNCCQRYSECLVTTLCYSRTVHRTPRRARVTVEPLHQQTPNVLALILWPPNSPDLSSVDYEIWTVMQPRVYHRQIHSVDELKRRLIVDVWCRLEQSIFDEAIDQWRGRYLACVHATGRHLKYSLWTDNVDFVHIVYSMWLVWVLHL